jgi:hypothetical protein
MSPTLLTTPLVTMIAPLKLLAGNRRDLPNRISVPVMTKIRAAEFRETRILLSDSSK